MVRWPIRTTRFPPRWPTPLRGWSFRQLAAQRFPTAIGSSSVMARTIRPFSSSIKTDTRCPAHTDYPGFRSASATAELAATIAAAINNVPNLNVTATAEGSIVRLDQLDMLDVRGAKPLLTSSNLVRIVGNGGADGPVDTIADNRPYLLGANSADLPLADGANLIVPQGVTVMIDAGALLKLTAANVDVGTSVLGANRATVRVQVLGTPEAAVYFRSYHNDAVGGDSDGPGNDCPTG